MRLADLNDIVATSGEVVAWNPDDDPFLRARVQMVRKGAAVPGWVRAELMPDNADYAVGLITVDEAVAIADGETRFVDGQGVEWRVEQSLPLLENGKTLGWRLFCRSCQGMTRG